MGEVACSVHAMGPGVARQAQVGWSDCFANDRRMRRRGRRGGHIRTLKHLTHRWIAWEEH